MALEEVLKKIRQNPRHRRRALALYNTKDKTYELPDPDDPAKLVIGGRGDAEHALDRILTQTSTSGLTEAQRQVATRYEPHCVEQSSFSKYRGMLALWGAGSALAIASLFASADKGESMMSPKEAAGYGTFILYGLGAAVGIRRKFKKD